jgi:Flp pilus assembly protein TadG
MLSPLRSRLRDDDRGSLSLFVVVVFVALLVTIGLVVDGGGKIRALQRADAVAAQAARAGGQAIVASTAVRGRGAVTDPAQARIAAQNYLSSADVPGTVTVINGTELRVTTSITYDPVFLSIIGVGTQTSTGEAEVRLAQVLNGEVAP